MKNIAFVLILILSSISSNLLAQADTIDYKNLKVQKIYPYTKNIFEIISNCRPCLIERYDEKSRLSSRYVKMGDCTIGKFIEYYKNGNIKLRGSLTQYCCNTAANITCGSPDGKWAYYKENGAPLYEEFWNKGTFIRQVPEQEQSEICGVMFHLDSQRIDTAKSVSIDIHKLKDLIITPKYKNSNTNASLSIELTIQTKKHQFTLEDFNDLDILNFIDLKRIPIDDTIKAYLTFFDEKKFISHYYIILTR